MRTWLKEAGEDVPVFPRPATPASPAAHAQDPDSAPEPKAAETAVGPKKPLESPRSEHRSAQRKGDDEAPSCSSFSLVVAAASSPTPEVAQAAGS